MSTKQSPLSSVKADPLFTRRVIMTTVGILILGFAVGIIKTAELGMDPYQVFCGGIHHVIPISFGTLYIFINIVLLIAMFFADRHYIGLGTLINLFLLGYMIEYSERFWRFLFPAPSLGMRFLLLILSLPIVCFASALYITADMGVSTYDIWALVLDKKTPLPFRLLRIGTDLICVIIGFVLMGCKTSGMIGIGTIIIAFFMGPLIDLFNRKVANPILYGRK